MEIRFSSRARKDFADLRAELKVLMRKQLGLLLRDLRHPSLQTKKYGGKDDLWQGRVNRDYRLIFRSSTTLRDCHDHTASEVSAGRDVRLTSCARGRLAPRPFLR